MVRASSLRIINGWHFSLGVAVYVVVDNNINRYYAGLAA